MINDMRRKSLEFNHVSEELRVGMKTLCNNQHRWSMMLATTIAIKIHQGPGTSQNVILLIFDDRSRCCIHCWVQD